MSNEIDLNKYQVRTDLAIESLKHYDNKTDIITTVKKENDINITTIKVKKDIDIINKKKGNYITIEFNDITDFENREKVGKIVEIELKKMLSQLNIKDEDEALIIGLGNIDSTPDSLGPKAIRDVMTTRHLFLLNTEVKEGIRKVSTFVPGVMGNNGIETYDVIKNLVDTIKPSFVIVIDSLCASSIERVNKTIQMTDTGILPGSGVGNTRKEISFSTLNVPVIAIGVPTVVDAVTIVNESIDYLYKHLAYIKNNQEKNRLIVTRFDNYINKLKKEELTNKEKKELMGLFGELSDIEKRSLINEVLTSINYNLIVTPKEIDFLVNKLSNLIASSINNSLHRQITHY